MRHLNAPRRLILRALHSEGRGTVSAALFLSAGLTVTAGLLVTTATRAQGAAEGAKTEANQVGADKEGADSPAVETKPASEPAPASAEATPTDAPAVPAPADSPAEAPAEATSASAETSTATPAVGATTAESTPAPAGEVASGAAKEDSKLPTLSAPAAESSPTDDADAATPWAVSGFVDSYLGFNWGLPKPQEDINQFRAFDASNGFAVSGAGVNAAYDVGIAAATLSLRLGPTAQTFAGEAESQRDLANVKQAYATWRPLGNNGTPGDDGALALDFGKFDTIFGAEVAESQDNYNYTRGFLNWLGQPFYHTGLRAALELTERWTATAIVVNGWDSSGDVNQMKSLGLQLGYGSERFDASVGYLVGPEARDFVLVLVGAALVTRGAKWRRRARTQGKKPSTRRISTQPTSKACGIW